jgi:hypothetical protein
VPSRRVFANPDKLTAQDALGDLALLNPCSLVDPDTLPDSWTVVIDVPVAFNFCEINVTTKEGAVVEARVGRPQPAWSAPEDYPSGARGAGISIVPGARVFGTVAAGTSFQWAVDAKPSIPNSRGCGSGESPPESLQREGLELDAMEGPEIIVRVSSSSDTAAPQRDFANTTVPTGTRLTMSGAMAAITASA